LNKCLCTAIPIRRSNSVRRGARPFARWCRRSAGQRIRARAIKQAVVGTGAADKAQVQRMISLLLNLPEPPQADAADALAVAICHGHTRQTLQRFGVAAAAGTAAMIGRLRGLLAGNSRRIC
jgi:hypothetical protein